jgi:FSR family fosmidomycin resistance protein-like MFS transporter
MESRKRKTTLATCCGMHILHDGLVDVLFVLLPILAQAFGLSYAQVGVIRAANRAGMVLFEIPSGMLAETFGERKLVVFGTLCAGVAFLFLGLSTGFVTILLSLFLAGFGAAFQHALCSSMITTAYATGGRRAALGVYNSTGDVGKLAFAGALTVLIAAGFTWQVSVFGFGFVALGVALVAFVLLWQASAGGRPTHATLGERAKQRVKGWGIRHRGGFVGLALIVVFDVATRSSFLTFLAFLMIDKQVPASLAGFAVLLTLVGGVFGKFSCGFLAERFGVIRTIVLTEIATGAGILLVLAAPTMAAYALLPFLGVVLNGTSTVIYGVVGDLVEHEKASRGFAFIYTTANAGSIVGPVGYGLLGDAIGISNTIAIMAFVVLLTLPLCSLLKPALAQPGIRRAA